MTSLGAVARDLAARSWSRARWRGRRQRCRRGRRGRLRRKRAQRHGNAAAIVQRCNLAGLHLHGRVAEVLPPAHLDHLVLRRRRRQGRGPALGLGACARAGSCEGWPRDRERGTLTGCGRRGRLSRGRAWARHTGAVGRALLRRRDALLNDGHPRITLGLAAGEQEVSGDDAPRHARTTSKTRAHPSGLVLLMSSNASGSSLHNDDWEGQCAAETDHLAEIS
jgi:hypothetical protein